MRKALLSLAVPVLPFDASGVAHITEALLADGFTDREVAMIMGGNAIRFLGANLP